jgi:hypothetical protein
MRMALIQRHAHRRPPIEIDRSPVDHQERTAPDD